MKIKSILIASIIFTCLRLNSQEVASQELYLEQIKGQMQVEWPKNKTINLVFHGHSVPAGYFKTPVVNTLASYPYIVLDKSNQNTLLR